MAFSSLGFNPTDDGYVLAYGRRILEGEVIHRDFVSIHPIGSPLLHAVIVLLGGENTFLLSRAFVWFEFAVIAATWSWLARRFTSYRLGPLSQLAIAFFIFILCSHYFPPMAWNTTDALLWFSVGVLLAVRQSRWKLVGYICIGVASLARQNFIFALPLTLVVLGDWRDWRSWIAGLVPGLGYTTWLMFAGAFPDAVVQLGSLSNLATHGFGAYFNSAQVLWGMLIGFLVLAPRAMARSSSEVRPGWILLWTKALTPVGLGLLAAQEIAAGSYSASSAFLLFGAALGATISLGYFGSKTSPWSQFGVLALTGAWAASISGGYNSPALGGGLTAAMLLGLPWASAGLLERKRTAIICGALMLALPFFILGRLNHIYRDRPAAELTEPLDGVMAGAAGVRTNEVTKRFMADLSRAIGQATHRYAIVPDLAAHWVKAESRNPLPIDWAATPEQLGHREMFRRLTESLEERRGNLLIIVAKVQAATLAQTLTPYVETHPDRSVVAYVRTQFTQVGETEFFELYR